MPTYRFDTLHLSIVYPGGFQSGANAGLVGDRHRHQRHVLAGRRAASSVTEQPIDMMFSLRNFTSGPLAHDRHTIDIGAASEAHATDVAAP